MHKKGNPCICWRATLYMLGTGRAAVFLFPSQQHKCYIVATCDRDLKRRLRKIPGVPIMYITQHRYSIERMPDAYGGSLTGGLFIGVRVKFNRHGFNGWWWHHCMEVSRDQWRIAETDLGNWSTRVPWVPRGTMGHHGVPWRTSGTSGTMGHLQHYKHNGNNGDYNICWLCKFVILTYIRLTCYSNYGVNSS